VLHFEVHFAAPLVVAALRDSDKVFFFRFLTGEKEGKEGEK
jgi:hypothetical protein